VTRLVESEMLDGETFARLLLPNWGTFPRHPMMSSRVRLTSAIVGGVVFTFAPNCVGMGSRGTCAQFGSAQNGLSRPLRFGSSGSITDGMLSSVVDEMARLHLAATIVCLCFALA